MPSGMKGEGEKRTAAMVAAKALTTERGGELVAATAAIAKPAHIQTGTPALGAIAELTVRSSPNSDHNSPVAARYTHIARATAYGASSNSWRQRRPRAAITSSISSAPMAISGFDNEGSVARCG